MKLKIIALLLVAALPLRAQIDATAKNVELPTFVITGHETVEFPKADKLPPPPVMVVSEDFLKPSYDPDLLQTTITSNPFLAAPKTENGETFYGNKLVASAGSVVLPSFTYSTLLNAGDFSTSFRLGSEYVLPYVTNSSSFMAAPQLDLDYKILQPGSFIDENKLHLMAGYSYQKYDLDWTGQPIERKVNTYEFGASLENGPKNFWKYKAGIRSHSLDFSNENIKENRTLVEGSAGFSGQNLEFTPSGELSFNSILDSTGAKHANTLFRVAAPIKVTISDVFSAFGAINMFAFDTIKSVNLNFGVQLRLNQFVSVAASYSPGYITEDFASELGENKFAAFNQRQMLAYEQKDKIDFSMTFESAKVYDVTVGFSTFSSDTYPFYYGSTNGKYVLETTNGTAFNVHADLRIHPSTLGYLIASVQVNAVKDTAGNILPNIPGVTGYAAYGYTLQKGITLKAGGRFMSKRYVDSANMESLPFFLSVFGELGYSFSREFLLTAKIDNLLNRKNLIFKGYQDRPFTLELGIEFQW